MVKQNKFSNIEGTQQSPEDLFATEKGLALDIGSGVEKFLFGEAVGAVQGEIKIGELTVQMGRVISGATAGTTFTISFPKPFKSPPRFVTVVPAGTGFPTNPNKVQIDGTNLPTNNQMTVGVISQTGNEYYYWLAIGEL